MTDNWWPTLIYIFVMGAFIFIVALAGNWPALVALAFISVGGTLNLICVRICAAIERGRK